MRDYSPLQFIKTQNNQHFVFFIQDQTLYARSVDVKPQPEIAQEDAIVHERALRGFSVDARQDGLYCYIQTLDDEIICLKSNQDDSPAEGWQPVLHKLATSAA